MNNDTRTKAAFGGILLVIIIVVILLTRNRTPEKPPPSGSGFYYTGPFRNKKNPNMWGDDNGRPVPPPPDAIPLQSGTTGKGGGTTGVNQ